MTTTTIKTPTLEEAQEMTGDPQAIARGYVSAPVIYKAIALANAAIAVPEFGTMGYLGDIGTPDLWWEENCPAFKDLCDSEDVTLRQLAAILKIANRLVQPAKINRVECRIEAIRVMGRSGVLLQNESEELSWLLKWVKRNRVS
jgi:hypothetical protein